MGAGVAKEPLDTSSASTIHPQHQEDPSQSRLAVSITTGVSELFWGEGGCGEVVTGQGEGRAGLGGVGVAMEATQPDTEAFTFGPAK